MADEAEPELPPLSILPPSSSAPSFAAISSATRKRVFRKPSFDASSDPAVFSSDDNPALDNYQQPRRKRKYRGTWFDQQPLSSDPPEPQDLVKRKKRVLTRQKDSGVYMSDGLSEDLDDADLPPVQPRLQLRPVQAMPRREYVEAVRRVDECIEDGKEIIDLSDLGLEEISNEMIEPLRGLAAIPVVVKDVDQPLKVTNLQFYMYGNQLSWLPRAVFNLENLTVLSVRNNNLAEIPPWIGQLKQLQHLNVAQNQLRYLPAELLGLCTKQGSLRRLIIDPNPLIQQKYVPVPDYVDAEEINTTNSVLFNASDSMSPVHLRKYTEVRIRRSDGSVVSDWPIDMEENSLPALFFLYTRNRPQPRLPNAAKMMDPRSRVPSLMELTLQACARAADLRLLPAMMPDEHSAARVRVLLDGLHTQTESGGLYCWQCRRSIVRPVVEWLEWWDLCQTDPLPSRCIPLIKRVCSWRCAEKAYCAHDGPIPGAGWVRNRDLDEAPVPDAQTAAVAGAP